MKSSKKPAIDRVPAQKGNQMPPKKPDPVRQRYSLGLPKKK